LFLENEISYFLFSKESIVNRQKRKMTDCSLSLPVNKASARIVESTRQDGAVLAPRDAENTPSGGSDTDSTTQFVSDTAVLNTSLASAPSTSSSTSTTTTNSAKRSRNNTDNETLLVGKKKKATSSSGSSSSGGDGEILLYFSFQDGEQKYATLARDLPMSAVKTWCAQQKQDMMGSGDSAAVRLFYEGSRITDEDTFATLNERLGMKDGDYVDVVREQVGGYVDFICNL